MEPNSNKKLFREPKKYYQISEFNKEMYVMKNRPSSFIDVLHNHLENICDMREIVSWRSVFKDTTPWKSVKYIELD